MITQYRALLYSKVKPSKSKTLNVLNISNAASYIIEMLQC